MAPSDRTVIVAAGCRTPIGSLNGALSSLSGHEIGAIAIKEALSRARIEPEKVSEVLIGQVLTAGQGQGTARQAAMKAGIPKEVPATGVSMVCGSGLKAVALGYQAILCGEAEVVVAAGQESMSQSTHCLHVRNGIKFGDGTLSDTMIKDGLTDAFNNYHMGITAENVAKQCHVTRDEQDRFATASQNKTEEAQKKGRFSEEIVPVSLSTRKGTVIVEKDEFPRPGTSVEGLSRLKPAFLKDGTGTITAGNASGINDGAAAIVLVTSEVHLHTNCQPLGKIVSWAQAGVDPSVMGLGPIPAVQKALAKARWSKDDVDLFELNEAFAAQSVAVIRALELDESKVNISGGAIALGHPIGASGTRILVTLLYALRRVGGKRGVAALCIGGGMGIAMCVETI